MIRQLAKTVVFGAALGPAIAVFVGWLRDIPLDRIVERPVVFLFTSAYMGVVYGVCFLLICGLPLQYLRRRLSRLPPWSASVVILAATAIGASAALQAVSLALSWTLGADFSGSPPLKGLLIASIVATAIAMVINTYERLSAERDAAGARAEAAALTAQIRPHFLFNTLNTISAQVTHDPAAAQENLARLGDMFRYTMSHARQDTAPLSDEIALTREYLLLEKARFGDRLLFDLPELPPAAANVQAPGLTLQPLVENAVRHGIAKRVDGGCISVSVEQAGESWILKVRNPTLGNETVSEDQLFREGHALWILRKRLPSLKVRQEPPGSFEVDVRLP